MTKFRRLIAGAAAGATVAGLAALAVLPGASAAVTRAGTPARTRVLHVRMGGQIATFTMTGDWKLAKVKLPVERLLRPKLVRAGTKHADATSSSGNWSGYADEAKTGTTFNSVTAYWNVPNLNCANSTAGPDGAWYADWTGLDGWGGGQTVEQEGTEEECASGTEDMFVFYEMYPAGPVGFKGAVPGDLLETTTSYNPSTKKFTLKVTDLTQNGAGGYVTEACASTSTCLRSSAEVISEAPGGGAPDYGLADFGGENYTNAAVVTAAGTKGGFASSSTWTSTAINMVAGDTHDTLATAGELSGGNAFLVRWVKSL
jgi:hypothetical protein